tara:strand:- start:101 stop:241 length:141 start_codon:yes stop_codon:yes gene_type:complete
VIKEIKETPELKEFRVYKEKLGPKVTREIPEPRGLLVPPENRVSKV